MRATQFILLQALSQAGEVSQGTLAGILAIDSTTLTRTLAIMGAVTE
jgi:DNA-binding MarR family transcriptional regulator